MRANAYPLAEYLADLRRAIWSGSPPDANRRALQRVYVQRLEAMSVRPQRRRRRRAAGEGRAVRAAARRSERSRS